MTDHANELRRYSRKIGHPAGDVPSVMLAAADEIERLAARLEAAEKSDAESLAMYRRARDERDALRAKLEATEEDRSRFLVEMGRLCAQCDALRAKIEAAERERDFAKTEIARLHDDIRELTDERVLDEEDRERIVAHLQGEAKAKLDSLEATEKDSAHHKALAESALRVAKGWEDKCDDLRAKIEAMEQQEPYSEWFDWLPQGTTHISEIRTVTIPSFGLEARFNAFKYVDGTLHTYRTDSDNEYGAWVKAASRYRNGVVPTVYALSEKITQAMLEGQVRDFSDAYQGAMEEVAIWKRRALEAETLNRKFIAGINGPMHMGEPAQPAPSVPDEEAAYNGWFRVQQGVAYDGMWTFARAAWMARAKLAAAPKPEAKP